MAGYDIADVDDLDAEGPGGMVRKVRRAVGGKGPGSDALTGLGQGRARVRHLRRAARPAIRTSLMGQEGKRCTRSSSPKTTCGGAVRALIARLPQPT